MKPINTREGQTDISQQPPLSSTLDLEGTEVSRLFHQIAVSKPLDEEAFYNNLLQKYPPNDNDADELPVYGDSGSEGQFDEQTWEEMQNEAKELQEHSGKPTLAEKPSIPRQECIELLSQHITRMETLWREKRLPRELAKAPGLWDHSHAHGGSLDQDKEDLTKRISFYQKRLERLKAGILEVEFKDRDIFFQSCASLDPTIADICLDKWTLEVLKLENRPPRVEPPPKIPKPRKEPLDTKEDESLASEIEIDLEEEDESSEFDGSASEDDESDFVEIDPEDETVQDLAELPHRGLPFTLDSPPPDDQAPPLEPSSKKRRIDNDDGSDSEVISDAGVFEAFRRGDIDTVDLTGVLPSSAGAGDPHSDALPTSSSRPQTAQDAEDSDDMQIETPPLNPAHSTAPKDADVEKLSLDNVQGSPARVKRLKLTAPRPPGSHAQHSRQAPDDDSDSTQGSSPIFEDLPFGVDREDIERFDTVIPLKIEAIAASKDRLELLTKCIIGLRPHEPKQIENLLDKNLLFQLMNVVHSALIQMLNNRQRLPDMDESESLAFMRLAVLYHSWLHCISLSAKGLDKQQIKDTIYRIETDETNFSFTRFVDALRKLLAAHEFWSLKHPVHSSSSHRLSTSSFKPHGNARHKLKYAPRNLSNMQKEAQERQKKQDAMRQERERRGLSNSDPDKQAVTFKEPVIYLHREIGEHVKPHQLAGIQFMWRELIEAEKPQGCLLAHVMGLGKTMQV